MIYNNTIYNNVPGVGINIFASSDQAKVKNNILYRNGGTMLDNGSNTVYNNNLLGDPKFVDEVNGNFKLQQGSPAINQGLPLVEVNHDFIGVTRPQQATHDLGAYEHSGSGDSTAPAAPRALSIQ
jgi:hypothetical protein